MISKMSMESDGRVRIESQTSRRVRKVREYGERMKVLRQGKERKVHFFTSLCNLVKKSNRQKKHTESVCYFSFKCCLLFQLELSTKSLKKKKKKIFDGVGLSCLLKNSFN